MPNNKQKFTPFLFYIQEAAECRMLAIKNIYFSKGYFIELVPKTTILFYIDWNFTEFELITL